MDTVSGAAGSCEPRQGCLLLNQLLLPAGAALPLLLPAPAAHPPLPCPCPAPPPPPILPRSLPGGG